MREFEDITSLYEHIEENALNYRDTQIATFFRNLGDLKIEEKHQEEAETAQYEVQFFYFVLKDGEIDSTREFSDEKGNIVEYPNIGKLNEKCYDYLVLRFDSTSNPKLKSRYGHILWFSPKKIGKYAQIAIESYLELIKIYEERDVLEPQEHYGHYVLKSIRNAHFLARNVNDGYLKEVTKSKIKSLIFHFNHKSTSSFMLKVDLIELMLSKRETFHKDDFIAIQHICFQMAEDKNNSENIHAAIRLFELGEKIDKKLGVKTHNWRLYIAESYERWMKQTEKNPLVAIDFCQHALENYRLIKNKDKIEALEIKYTQLKSSFELETIEFKYDPKEHIEFCRRLAKHLAKHDPEEIIRFLMYDKALLPTYKDTELLAQKRLKENPISKFFPQIILDNNGHPAQHFYGDDEMLYYNILDIYKLGLEITYIPKIHTIIFEAIRRRKLSAKIFIDFILKYSWFGKTIIKNLPNGQKLEYNWLSLISPSIIEYFNQIEYSFASGNYPNLVLPLDSLTLKIEGLVRDLCESFDISTFTQLKDKNKNIIIREKDINALLHEQKMNELFDEDDLILLKFLLVEKAGYNLRHNIAHSLATYIDYNINYMNLLILVLLRLGKYSTAK